MQSSGYLNYSSIPDDFPGDEEHHNIIRGRGLCDKLRSRYYCRIRSCHDFLKIISV
jgi:hypothetical protein